MLSILTIALALQPTQVDPHRLWAGTLDAHAGRVRVTSTTPKPVVKYYENSKSAPLYHLDKVKVMSGVAQITYNDSSHHDMGPSDAELTVRRRWTNDEKKLMSAYSVGFGTAVRTRGGFDPYSGIEVPLFLLSIAVPNLGDKMDVKVYEADTLIFEGESAAGFLTSADMRNKLRPAVSSEANHLQVLFKGTGGKDGYEIALMSKRREAKFSREWSAAAQESTRTLVTLERARICFDHHLDGFGLYELKEAQRLGPDYPWADDFIQKLEKGGVDPIPPSAILDEPKT